MARRALKRAGLTGLFAFGALLPMLLPCLAQAREWQFAVYLDDDLIGTHRFTLTEQGDSRLVSSEARFSVKLLSFEIYRYQHQASEVWRGDCLERLTARTDDNGTVTEVDARSEGPSVRVKRTGGSELVSGCLRSYAYWNPRLLVAPRLINAQDGVIADVSFVMIGADTIRSRGQNVPARRHQLKTPKLAIDLWYDATGEWLALESTTASGRRVRYRLE